MIRRPPRSTRTDPLLPYTTLFRAKPLTLNLADPLDAGPADLAQWTLELAAEGYELVYEFDSQAEATGVPSLLRRMSDIGIQFKDLHTKQSSLEDIFVGLVREPKGEERAA